MKSPYTTISRQDHKLSTLFGNEKLRESSVNVKPLLFGRRRHRIESVMFAPTSKSSTVLPFRCCDLNVCLWFCLKQLCTFVSCLSDICINLTDVTGEICVCHHVLESFECCRACKGTCFRHVLYMYWFCSMEWHCKKKSC